MLSSDKHPKVWVFACLFYGTLLAMLSLSKSLGINDAELRALARLMGGDKWFHFWSAGVLSFLVMAMMRSLWGQKKLVVICCFSAASLSVALVADELLQGLSSNRAVDVRDVLYGMLGVLSGIALYTSVDALSKLLTPAE